MLSDLKRRPFGRAMIELLARFQELPTTSTAAFAVVAAAGVLCHRLLERPLDAVLRGRRERRPKPA